MQAVAQESGQQISVLSAGKEGDIDNTFTALAQRGGALIVSTDPFFVSRLHQIIVLAAYHKIPTIYDRREFIVAGGLVSYGTHLSDAYRQIGVYAGRIIKGSKPSDLPVIQPTRFELVINQKTAKALGLMMPDKLLALAAAERKELIMAVRTECRGAAADAGVVPGSYLPALANPRAPFSASFSKRWLSGANHRRIPQCPSAIDCGAPNRYVHRRGAVSLPGSKSPFTDCTGGTRCSGPPCLLLIRPVEPRPGSHRLCKR